MTSTNIQVDKIEEPCRLCGRMCIRQLSHLIPAFVFRWLKATSGNGHIRSSEEPDKRTQDGVKRYWLCTKCEQLFSGWEGQFASKIFHPYSVRSGDQFQYEGWMLRFATSVSWRVLIFALDEGNVEEWSEEVRAKAGSAEIVWRDFLLGKTNHPGDFRQLVVPMDEITGFDPDMPESINRYLMRAVDLSVPHAKDWAYTFAKMGRFIVLGQIVDPMPNQWRSARISANHGVIGPKKYELPMVLWSYLKSRARNTREALASMSTRQQEKVDQSFRANVDRYHGSDSFKAMRADISSFGRKAFLSIEDDSDTASSSSDGSAQKP